MLFSPMIIRGGHLKIKNLLAAFILSTSFLNSTWAEDSGTTLKRVNIHTNPITWLVGLYSLGADVAVTDKFTVGGSYNVFDFSS